MNIIDRSKVIFGNEMSAKDYNNAVKSKKKFARRFPGDKDPVTDVQIKENAVIGEPLGVKEIRIGDGGEAKTPEWDLEKGLIVGNIRMGFGHYRISMAIASAAHALGYTPYWMDLNGFPNTACTKIIGSQNDLYSMGSRLSGKSKLFNKFFWDKTVRHLETNSNTRIVRSRNSKRFILF